MLSSTSLAASCFLADQVPPGRVSSVLPNTRKLSGKANVVVALGSAKSANSDEHRALMSSGAIGQLTVAICCGWISPQLWSDVGRRGLAVELGIWIASA